MTDSPSPAVHGAARNPAHPASSPSVRPSSRASLWIVLGLAGLLLVAIALLLWARYGTTVFFDVMNAGLATCL